MGPAAAAVGVTFCFVYQFLTYYCLVLFSRRKLRHALIEIYTDNPKPPEEKPHPCDKKSDAKGGDEDFEYDRDYCVNNRGNEDMKRKQAAKAKAKTLWALD